MKLQTKLILILTFVFLTLFTSIEYFQYQSKKKEVVNELLSDARNIRSILMSTRRVYHKQFLESCIPLNDKTLGFLPAYALSRISDDFRNWSKNDLYFNNVSDRPRNPDNAADSLEKEAISFYLKNPSEKERFVPFKSEEGESFYHFSAPIWVEEYCLKCHGKREDAHVTIRTRYATAFDYEVGELRGIMSIKLPVTQLQATVWARIQRDFWIHLASFSSMFFLVSWLLRHYITTPMVRLTRGLNEVAEGRFDQPIDRLSGEMAIVGNTFNLMSKRLKQREDELRESEKNYSTLANISPVGIFHTDAEGHCLYVNERWCKITGLTVEEALGEGWLQALHPEDSERVFMLWQQSVKNKSGFNSEYRFLHTDNKTTWVLGQATPEIGENGEIASYVGTITDITEHKRIETKLRESEKRFRELAENITEVFWVASPDLNNMIYVNPEFKTIWGHSCKSLYEQPGLWNDSIHPEERENIIKTITEHIKEEKDFMVEYRIIRQDKDIRWIYNRGFLIRNEYGKIYRIAGIAEDITERKLAEKQIKASLEEKEILLKEIHHRVKNNMQVISSLIKFQSENIKDERYAEMFKDCQNRIRTMSLIHEKLYSSKDIANIKMNDYIKSLVNEIFRSYRKGNTIVRLKMEIEDISIGIDSSIPCGLVINEMVSNSLKYAFPVDNFRTGPFDSAQDRPDGKEGEIKISLCMLDSGEIELIFSDNGIGIPKDIDYRNTKSLGLRLIVNLTEHQLNGRIELDRSEGTKFRITFKEAKYKKRI